MATFTPTSTVAPTVSPTGSSTAASSSLSFAFQTMPEMFTCGETQIHWGYAGPASPLSFIISNINVYQQAPLNSSSTSATTTATSPVNNTLRALPDKRQYNGFGGSYLPAVNVIIATGVNATTGVWQWDAVYVPQGWYRMSAVIPNAPEFTSLSFFVVNGSNTACIPQFDEPPSTSATSSLLTSSSLAPVHTAVAANSSKSNVGAIAGGIIGGIAFLAAVLAAFVFLCLRRRSARSRPRNENDTDRPWSVLSFMKFRPGNDARSSIQKPLSGPTVDANQTFMGSDEEFNSVMGHEKMTTATPHSSLPSNSPLLPTRSQSQSQRTSTQSNSSYGHAASSTDPRVRRAHSYKTRSAEVIPLERTQSGSHCQSAYKSETRVRRSNSCNAHPVEVNPLERAQTSNGSPGSPVRRSGSYSARQAELGRPNTSGSARQAELGRPNTSGSARQAELERPNTGSSARRKPVPRYEGDAEIDHGGIPSSQTKLNSPQHNGSPGDPHDQSSFGAMRPMHVMTSDPPLSTRT